MINDLEQHGVLTLAAMSKEVGILGANRKMQELMKERNDKIMAAYEEHPGIPDEAFQGKVNVIVEDYHARILLEAERFKANGEVDDFAGTAALVQPQPQIPGEKDKSPKGKKGKKDSSDGDDMTIIIAVAAGAGGLLLLIIIMVLVYKLKAKKSTPPQKPGAQGHSPYDGDSNVVMGRPIEGGAAAEAAQGAPVQKVDPEDLKGQGDPEKGKASEDPVKSI